MEVLVRVFQPILQNWLNEQMNEWEKERGSKSIWHNGPIDLQLPESINNIVAGLLKEGKSEKIKKIDLVFNSLGGSIESAYQIISLLDRKFPTAEITFVVPRVAKSAATLIALGCDSILFSQIGELGPLDVQIYRPGCESPISGITIKKLVEEELEKSSNENMKKWIFNTLKPEEVLEMKRFNDVAVKYLEYLLPRRMFKDQKEDKPKIQKVINAICEEFPNHSFVIDKTVAKETLGLNASFVSEKEEIILQNVRNIWEYMFRLSRHLETEKENLILKRILDNYGK